MPKSPATPSWPKMAWSFLSIPKAPIICAAPRSIITTAAPAPAFTSKTQMLPGLAGAVRLSKQPALLENESFANQARLDGSGLLSLRRAVVRARAPEKDQRLRMVGHD